MENSNQFRVWNTYPLLSVEFLIISLITAMLTGSIFYLYRSSQRRLLIGLAAFLMLFYTMFIWNICVNLIPEVDGEILIAYVIYTMTACGLYYYGVILKDPYLQWGGWFFLIFTVVHLVFVNIWLISLPYKLLSLFVVGVPLIINRHMFFK